MLRCGNLIRVSVRRENRRNRISQRITTLRRGKCNVFRETGYICVREARMKKRMYNTKKEENNTITNTYYFL